MGENKMHERNMMVYTPEFRIPLGEAVKTSTGEYALKIKKASNSQTEIVPIKMLLSQIKQTIGNNC